MSIEQSSGGGGQILNIPQFISGQSRASVTTDHETESDTDNMTETESHTTDNDHDHEDGGIGLDDDGRSGKLTLSILLSEKLIEPGDGVMSIDYLGQTFKGDLLSIGKIRSLETGLIFNNPSAWAIYCKKIINPAKKSGCGWASVKYKGRKMDYFKNIWVKRKAQRDAETAKNEAAQALTALSAGLSSALPEPVTVSRPVTHSTSPSVTSSSDSSVMKHSQLTPGINHSKRHFVELEPWTHDGRMQPFTISVSTSAMLILDLHSHLSTQDCCGYLAGHWDANTHNLAITTTYPCLISPEQAGTEHAQKIESSIYDDLYGKHLSLVGWYHSNPRGPAAPSVKDCYDQLEFQIKLLGNNDANYTPCIGVICSPYEKQSKTSDSSIVFYWVYPPGESLNQDLGKPMRMSYSVIQDPCLSEDVLQTIDKTISFFNSQPKESQVKYTDKYADGQHVVEKIGRSLVSKFPQDQDERLWLYIQTQLLQGAELKETVLSNGVVTLPQHPLPPPPDHDKMNGRKHSEEEEIDDDEETALNTEQEIDDDEDTAIVTAQKQLTVTPVVTSANTVTISQFSPMGTHMTFTRANDGGQETVNLSIKETDEMETDGDIAKILEETEQDQPLALTSSKPSENTAQSAEEAPLNFSTSASKDNEEDSDDERLVIKE